MANICLPNICSSSISVNCLPPPWSPRPLSVLLRSGLYLSFNCLTAGEPCFYVAPVWTKYVSVLFYLSVIIRQVKEPQWKNRKVFYPYGTNSINLSNSELFFSNNMVWKRLSSIPSSLTYVSFYVVLTIFMSWIFFCQYIMEHNEIII